MPRNLLDAITRHLRRLAKARGIDPKTVRVTYGKVAEMQRRGVVHFHAIIRLDGIDPNDPDAIVPPPAELDAAILDAAILAATPGVRFTTDPHPAKRRGWPIAWGAKGVDVRAITIGTGDLTDGHVAGYLAKYATKSTEATGHLSARVTDDTIDLYANPTGSHTERLIDACWTLGRPKAWRGLRRWAHMLGFGGHFLTKSRRYSVTFRILRDARTVWRRTEHTDADPGADATVLIGYLTFAGSGWNTPGDQLLAHTAAATRQRRQSIAQEEENSA